MSAIKDLGQVVRGTEGQDGALLGVSLVLFAKQIDATNARLRQFGLHDPKCARLRDEQEGFGHRPPGIGSNIACDCWLSLCTEGEHPKKMESWMVTRVGCTRCRRLQEICTEGHCMICGTDTKPEEAKD